MIDENDLNPHFLVGADFANKKRVRDILDSNDRSKMSGRSSRRNNQGMVRIRQLSSAIFLLGNSNFFR